MNCRACEFLSSNGEDNVCGFPSDKQGHFVSKKWDEKPFWCPMSAPSNIPEDWRGALFVMYQNSGLKIPERLYPTKQYHRELPEEK